MSEKVTIEDNTLIEWPEAARWRDLPSMDGCFVIGEGFDREPGVYKNGKKMPPEWVDVAMRRFILGD